MLIVHFTTAHPRTDTRIRVKEAATLKKALDSDVHIFVQDGLGNEDDSVNELQIIDTGSKANGRVARMAIGAWRMFMALAQKRPDIAHFHDPELIPVGFLLKLLGVKIVYDVHEDLPRQILNKGYLSSFVRRPIAAFAEVFEWLAGKLFDGIVPATPVIGARFPQHKTVLVQNFPILAELTLDNPTVYRDRPPFFAYVGGISANRGTEQMLQAMDKVADKGARLQLAGVFQPEKYIDEVKAFDGWNQVDFKGWADRAAIAALLGSVRAGLVVLLPTPSYISAQPVKLYEYMAAGLPVIASDFPLWRQIVDDARCGLLVDPTDPDAIAKAMEWILDNPEEAEAMGARGRMAVMERYNWTVEGEKLVAYYRDHLGVPPIVEQK